jgi:hypothetical protein
MYTQQDLYIWLLNIALIGWVVLFIYKTNWAMWIVWDLSGLRFIWEKISPPAKRLPNEKPPSTFMIWAFGVVSLYIALYGLASQRYENRIDVIENRSHVIYAQLSTSAYKKAIGRIPQVQDMWCPEKPEIHEPFTIIRSLVKKARYDEMVSVLRETIEDWRENLDYVDLSNAKLHNAVLTEANFQGAQLNNAILQDTWLYQANLRNSSLEGANLEGAYLVNAQLKGTVLGGANLQYADLSACNELTVDQLCNVKTLYRTQLDQTIMNQVESRCPHLLVRPNP